jgi:hypothetical protein
MLTSKKVSAPRSVNLHKDTTASEGRWFEVRAVVDGGRRRYPGRMSVWVYNTTEQNGEERYT